MSNENGSTLIIGILIIAAVVASSVVLAGVMVKNFALTGEIDDMLSAYYASETGAEYGLYHVALGDDVNGHYGDINGEEEWSLTYDTETDAIVEENGLSAGEVAQIDLYDTTNDTALSESDFKAMVDWDIDENLLNEIHIEWSLYGWEDNMPITFDTRGVEIAKELDSPQTCLLGDYCGSRQFNLEGGKKYILRFKAFCSGIITAPCVISSYKAYAHTNGSLANPLPLSGTGELTSTGKSAGKKYFRSLKLYLPSREHALPVFDYGLFSEGAIAPKK